MGRVFDGKVSPKVAFWTAVVSSNMPDLDIVYRFEGAAKYFAEHRGYSHSVAGIPVEALGLAGVVYLFSRKNFGWIYLIALLGGLGHMILDLLNPYGTYALLPFSDKRYALDLVFIVDPFVWLILIVSLVWGRVKFNLRKVTAMAVLVVFGGYALLRLGAHELAGAKLLAHSPAPAAEKVVDYGIYPDPLRFWYWGYVLETKTNFYRGELSLLGTEKPSAARYAKVEENEYAQAAKRSYMTQVFLGFARFPYLSFAPVGENVIVRWDDLRYTAPGETNFFSARVLVSPDKKITELEAPPFWMKRLWRRLVNKRA